MQNKDITLKEIEKLKAKNRSLEISEQNSTEASNLADETGLNALRIS